VTLPDGSTAPADVVASAGRWQVRFSATHQSGIYRMRVPTRGGTSVYLCSVQGGDEESDLTPLPAERWEWLAKSLAFERADRPERVAVQHIASQSAELSDGLIISVIGLLMLEMGLGPWWSVR
jgi:hypothetical protein